jgi:hypothetical protein
MRCSPPVNYCLPSTSGRETPPQDGRPQLQRSAANYIRPLGVPFRALHGITARESSQEVLKRPPSVGILLQSASPQQHKEAGPFSPFKGPGDAVPLGGLSVIRNAELGRLQLLLQSGLPLPSTEQLNCMLSGRRGRCM